MADDIDISPAEAAEILKNDPTVKLLDVREDFEREICCIPDSIQLSEELAEEMIQNWDKSTPIIFQCHHGGRSASAAYYFMQHGFTNVKNMAGGIHAWSLQVDPSVARY